MSMNEGSILGKVLGSVDGRFDIVGIPVNGGGSRVVMVGSDEGSGVGDSDVAALIYLSTFLQKL